MKCGENAYLRKNGCASRKVLKAGCFWGSILRGIERGAKPGRGSMHIIPTEHEEDCKRPWLLKRRKNKRKEGRKTRKGREDQERK